LAGKQGGAVSAFAIEPSGKLTLLNQQSTVGAGPCYVGVDKAGKNALVANYSGGSVAVLPINSDGKLGEASAFRAACRLQCEPETPAGAARATRSCSMPITGLRSRPTSASTR